MGYKRNPKVYNLAFGEDTDYPGLEVRVRTLSMGQLLKVWAGATSKGSDTYELFVERLVGWNVEDENTGEPVPATREAVEAEDDDLINAIIKAWIKEVMGVSAPLESDSSGGGTSAAELRLAELPSESLVS